MLNLTRNINPTQEHISEYVSLSDDKIAHRYGIISTSFVEYAVWEPSAYRGKHFLITTIDGKVYGNITTRDLPAELNALPAGSEERIKAIHAWHTANDALAEALIRTTFPHDFEVSIFPVCGHRYTVKWEPNLSQEEIADMRSQLCPGCIEQMLAFERACEEEDKEQQPQREPTEAELDEMEARWEDYTFTHNQ